MGKKIKRIEIIGNVLISPYSGRHVIKDVQKHTGVYNGIHVLKSENREFVFEKSEYEELIKGKKIREGYYIKEET